MELIDSIKDYPPTRSIESLKGTAFAFSFFFFNASLAKSLHSGAERATLGGFASKKKYELAPSQFPRSAGLWNAFALKETRRRRPHCSTKEVQVQSTIECSKLQADFCIRQKKTCFDEFQKHFM